MVVVLTRWVLLGLGAVGLGFGIGLLMGCPPQHNHEFVFFALALFATDVLVNMPMVALLIVVFFFALPMFVLLTAMALFMALPRFLRAALPVLLLPTRILVAALALSKPEVSHVKTPRKVVALIFDAGADKGETAQMLRLLRERGVCATFFVTGRFAELFLVLVAEMVADGHEIANHTYDYKDLVDLTDEQIVAQLERTDTILRGFSGVFTKPLMRALFGSCDVCVRAAIDAAGYRSIYWVLDGGDWKPGAMFGYVVNVFKKATAGDVIVQHCSISPTAAALFTVLTDLGKCGLAVVTVSSLFS